MDKELLKLEEQIYSQCADNISGVMKALTDSRDMISDLKAIADEKDRVIARLENENESNKEKAERLSGELKDKTAEIERMSGDRALFEKMKVGSLELAELINDEREKTAQLDNEIKKYAEAKEKILSENEKLKNDLLKARNEIIKNKQALDKETVAVRNKDGEIDELNKKIKELKKKNADLEKENEKLGNKNLELVDQNSDLEERKSELEQQLQTLSGERDSDADKIRRLSGEIAGLRKDIDWLTNYAKGTDDKVKKFFRDDKQPLTEHNNWLCNRPKDDTYKKFFEPGNTGAGQNGNNSAADSGENREKHLRMREEN